MKVQKIVKDLMQPSVKVLKAQDSLRAAWNLFREHGISGAPVVDDNGRLIGLLSQVDLLREAFNPLASADLSTYCKGIPYLEGDMFMPSGELDQKTVDFAMHQGVVTVTEDQEVSSVARLMVEQNVHRVIVVNSLVELQVVGIVSSLDLAKLLI